MKSQTQLAKERKFLPDLSKPDAAYRIVHDPYYAFLFDERKAMHQPLTARQQAAIAAQKATVRQRYGCRLCDRTYGKADQDSFTDGVCTRCAQRVAGWNELISWARELLESNALILDIQTTPSHRPATLSGAVPHACGTDRACFRPESYMLTGYSVTALSSGEALYQVSVITREADLIDLRHFICPPISPIVIPDLVLMAGPLSPMIAQRAVLYGRDAQNLSLRNPALQLLPTGRYQVPVDGAWKDLVLHGDLYTERLRLEIALSTCDIDVRFDDPGETITSLLRRLVLHLAGQELIAIDWQRRGRQEKEKLES